MIIRPDFYRDLNLERRAERAKLQLDPDRPTGIVMFGGHGSKVMRGIAKRLDDTQLILTCGHNAALADELRALKCGGAAAVIGFTAQIRYYMQLSDFFIGKPGPGSISEAVQQRLPVIVVRNAWTMPQERYNTEWVQEHGAGVVLDSFKAIRDGVRTLTAASMSIAPASRAFRIGRYSKFRAFSSEYCVSAAARRIGVDFIQHFRSAQRLHLT